MHRWAVMLVWVMIATAVRGETGPRLVCEEPEYHFGEADASQVIEHTFVLTNAGDRSVTIDRVKASCGCTAARLRERILAPGQTADLKTRLSLRGRHGKQRKLVTVSSNDPEQPNLRLYLTGTVSSALRAVPARVYFGNVSTGEVAVRTVRLTGRDGVRDLSRLESDSSRLEVRGKPAGDGYEVRIATRPPLEVGVLRAEVRVAAKGHDLTIPVTANVAGPVIYAPRELVLSRASAQPVTRYVIVRSGSDRTVAVTGVDVPDESIKVDIQPMGERATRVRLSGIRADAALAGRSVLIRTTCPDMPSIRIPFTLVPEE